jgi:murein DD-endopeptidase MepM/ murein hydrolase activator NlpD
MNSMRSGSRRLVIAVSIVCAGIAAGGSSAFPAPPDGASEILRVTPASPVQGDTLMVTVSAPRRARVVVRYDGAAATAYILSDGTRRALIGTDPTVPAGSHEVAVTITEAGAPAVRASRVVRINPGRFEVRTLTLPPQTFGLITPQNGAIEWRALGPVLGRRTPEAMWTGVFAAPSDGVMDSPYGYQSVYNGHREWWHQGVDFAAPAGSPVAAANAGVVALAQLLPLGGNTVVIDHGQGILTEYLHLSAFAVRVGARVGRGAPIGRIGATGLVTGPSLHWGLYVNGTWVNPLFWTEPRAGLTQ